MLVRDGRIAAVGDPGEIRAAAGPGAQVARLDGATVVPGLIDAHCHVADIGYLAAGADCSQPSAPDIPAIQARLREAAARTPAGSWVTGSGYVEYQLREGRHPTRDDLDAGRAGPPGRAVPHVAARLRAEQRGAAGGRVRRPAAGSAGRRLRPRRRGPPRRRGVRGADVRAVRAQPAGRHRPDGRRRAGPPDAAGRAAPRGARHHRGLRRGPAPRHASPRSPRRTRPARCSSGSTAWSCTTRWTGCSRPACRAGAPAGWPPRR